jgi:ubiquinone biosynthesis O-methyltransferase
MGTSEAPRSSILADLRNRTGGSLRIRVMIVAPRTRRVLVAACYGVVCHGLFIAAVAAMMVMMFFGMSRSFGHVTGAWRFAANALLLLQFPLVHSLLLTSRGRKMLLYLAPGGLGRDLSTTTYVIIASLQVLALFLLWSPSGTIWWRAEGALFVILCWLYALAWLSLLKSIVDAGFALQTGLLGWYAVARGVAVRYPPMPQGGLFRFCRQPIYVSFAATTWTVPTWTPDQLAVASALTLYCLIGPLLKESRFKSRFGHQFEAYRRRVPYWIPRPSEYKMTSTPQSTRLNHAMYDTGAKDWWTGRTRWLRLLSNMVPPRLAYFTPIVGDWRGKSVLDLGCGGGFMAEPLARRGAHVIGVDPSAPAIEAARRHAEESGLSIDYRVGTGEKLPVENGAVDIVVCVDVLEHVRDLDAVIGEVRRVLKPGGLFLFDTINRTWLSKLVYITLGEIVLRLGPRGTHDPALFIKPEELRAKLEQREFAVAERLGGIGPRGLDRRFDITFGRWPSTAVTFIGHAHRHPQ